MLYTVFEMERRIEQICRSSYPYEWDENHLSYLLMKELRSMFSNRVLRFQSWSKIVDWKSFKSKGTLEQKFGDIALIVNIQFSSNEILKGVAFLEAKRSFNSNNYESLVQSQLVRIYQEAPYSHLLLYNHNIQNLHLKFPDDRTWSSHIWTTPLNTAIPLSIQLSQSDTWKLHRISLPFTSFLTSRIFWGLDLDFRDSIYKDVERGIADLFPTTFLGVVNVYYDNQEPLSNEIGDSWEEI